MIKLRLKDPINALITSATAANLAIIIKEFTLLTESWKNCSRITFEHSQNNYFCYQSTEYRLSCKFYCQYRLSKLEQRHLALLFHRPIFNQNDYDNYQLVTYSHSGLWTMHPLSLSAKALLLRQMRPCHSFLTIPLLFEHRNWITKKNMIKLSIF